VLAGPPQVTHEAAAVRFTFSVIADGSACFSISQSSLKDSDGFSVTHVVSAPTCIAVQYRATANGSVYRQGVVANPNPGGGTLACSRVVVNGGTYGPSYTDTNGAFKIVGLPVGTYTFFADYPGYLGAQKTGVAVVSGGYPPVVYVGSTTLRGGDANDDDKINILDIGLIISKWGKTGSSVRSATPANCTAADEYADINDDGNVNISDLAIAAGNWGLVGPTVWP
jgi:hypothetical protein